MMPGLLAPAILVVSATLSTPAARVAADCVLRAAYCAPTAVSGRSEHAARSTQHAVPATQPAPTTHVVVISGAGGEPQYSASFHAAASTIVDAARGRLGVPATGVIWLGEDTARAGGRMRARSTRENVERELTALAGRARAGDQVWIVVIGHGSGQGDASRVNLPGPDLTAADFARLLGGFRRQQVAFVNAASASGDFVKALAGPDRAIVTATKSALERNETRFARHFAAALGDGGADVDKDGRTSLLEAYAYARREVARAYATDNTLLTEHALLDDDGDGVGTAEPKPAGGDGALAAALALGGAAASTDPRVAALVAEQRALEGRIAALRQRRASMDSTAYERELEGLLVQLARKGAEVRAAGAKP